MLGKTERIDHQHVETGQFFDFGVRNGLEVGQVGQPADAESRHCKAFRMVSRNGEDFDTFDAERPRNVDLVQFDFRNAPVLVLREGVVEILAHDIEGAGSRIEVDAVDRRRVIDEIEGPHVVQPADMVLMFVRQQNGVDTADAGAQHLTAEIGSGVDDDAHVPRLDHGRGAQTVVAPVGRSADPAAASDDRDTLRGARSQKGKFHADKNSKNMATAHPRRKDSPHGFSDKAQNRI